MHGESVTSDAPPATLTVGTVVLDRGRAVALWLPTDMLSDEPSAPDFEVDLSLFDDQDRCVTRLSEVRWIAPDRIRIDLPSNHALQLWHVDHPVLYSLRGRVRVGSCDRAIDQPFGWRWFEAGENHILLNNDPFYIRGCIRGITAHDHPNLSGLDDAAWHARLIRQAKSFGLNFIRWHSTIPSESFLDQADLLGITNQVELGFDKIDEQLVVDEAAWRDMIFRICRHPSVAVYCVGNEIRRPGQHPQVQSMVKQAKAWDPSVLAADSCGWGEPDRVNADVYVQHVAYYFPYAEHKTMFDRIDSFELEGFVQPTTTTHTQPLRPVVAHEVCHYIAMRDLDRLERQWRVWRDKFQPDANHSASRRPRWVAQLRKLYGEKNLMEDEPALRRASRAFQRLTQRHSLESIRRSPALCGFQMLQLTDCWKYENSNGLLDSFDEPLNWEPEAFARFNGDIAVVAELRDRVFACGQSFTTPIHVSHFGAKPLEPGRLVVELQDDRGEPVDTVSLSIPAIAPATIRRLAEVTLSSPVGDRACQATLVAQLETPTGTWSNEWSLWLLPMRTDTPAQNDRLLTSLSSDDLRRIEAGDHRVWMYRPDDLFDAHALRPALDWEGRRDLFKGVIWDRGDNLGALVRPHPAIDWLPNAGHADWQFAPLIHHGCKINLDSFPVPIRPIVQGVDRPVRDRMEVSAYGHKDLKPANTARKWGWLFDLAIGKGRLLVCGFNITADHPLACHTRDQLLGTLDHLPTTPSATIERGVLEEYLVENARHPRPDEGPMTQYWLNDDQPVETILFWEALNIKLT